MEVVERFAVTLDLSDCPLLYDYVECREYERPTSGAWDLTAFRGKGTLDCVAEDDENGQMRVHLLDNAFTDKRHLEKHCKAKDKGSTLAFDGDACGESELPKRVIPIFKAGDVIKGRVEIVLNRPMEAERMVVGLLGHAYARTRYYHQHGYYDRTESEVFTKQKIPLWLNTEYTDIDPDQFSLVGQELLGAVPRGREIPQGTHSYPFEFAIPPEVPQSAPPMVISCHNKGYLVYRLKAAIDKGKTMARGNIVTHKGLWVRKQVDIASDPKNMQPVDIEQTLDTGTVTFWKSGKITVRVKLPRMGYLIGDNVPFTLEIDNESKGVINKISCCVRMHGKTGTGSSINVKSEKVTEGPVSAGMCPVFQLSLPWDFSDSSVDGNLLPVGDLNDCKLLDIKYELRIKLNRKGLHRNMEISVPISVGNVNSMA